MNIKKYCPSTDRLILYTIEIFAFSMGWGTHIPDSWLFADAANSHPFYQACYFVSVILLSVTGIIKCVSLFIQYDNWKTKND